MANLARDDVEEALLKKGFRRDERDHSYFKLYSEDRYTGIYTKTSRGKKYKTLGDELVSKMARQVKLTKSQFVNLVNCPLSREEYLRLLDDRDLL